MAGHPAETTVVGAQGQRVKEKRGRSCCWQCCLLVRWGIPPSFKLASRSFSAASSLQVHFPFHVEDRRRLHHLVLRTGSAGSLHAVRSRSSASTGGSRCFSPARCFPLGTIRGLVEHEAVGKGILVLLFRMPWSGRPRTRPKAEKVTCNVAQTEAVRCFG